MGFLDLFSDPSFQNVDVNRFRRYEDPVSPYTNQNHGLIQSRGMIDQVGSRGMFGRPQKSNPDHMSGGNPAAGLLGIQNTTGFSQEAPNVIYDQGPEQFNKELALRRRGLDIQEKQADANIANNDFNNQIRLMNANTAAGRNDIAMYKTQNPNMIIKASAGGTYHAIDPQTGEAVDTGIPVGNMTQEGAINLRQRGALEQIGARNEGAMNVARMNNDSDMARAILSSATAKDIAVMRENGMLDRLLRGAENTRTNNIFREGQNTWRTRLKEGLVNPDDPLEGQPPAFPRGDISLDPTKQGFSATPGQYDAKPGQYDAPVGGKNPVTGAPAGGGNAPTADVKPDPTNPNMSLVKFPDGKVRRVPNAEVKSVIDSFGSILIKGAGAGEVGKTPAGQVTGPSAGQVR